MSFGERFALEGLLSQLRPALAIEIGTAEGGSLRRIAAHAGEVHSFDVDPKVAELEEELPGVVFHIGDSAGLLPATLAELAAAGRNVDFVLVDGDHSSEGVERDARALLDSDACRETTIVFHDAANDDVRAGLARLDLLSHPKVAACFLDFVPGYLCRPDHPRFPSAIWNGLGLVVLGERGGEVILDRDHLEVPELYRRVRDDIRGYRPRVMADGGFPLGEGERRGNGLPPAAPDPDQTILVAGGAGYIGAVLVPRLLDRGYRVRVLDRLYFGDEAIAGFRDRIELVVADVRAIPPSALDGIDGVINLSGLSNDPTAEFDPEANWQMNALATEALGRLCVERGIERYVFASSCALYDGLPPGMHDETAPIRPYAAYATSKRYGEERLLELAQEGLCPVLLRNGTVYGYSPRMRFDLVVNTFVKDALLDNRLLLHGGGWMWRPLVDVRDVSDALILGYEAPAEQVRGEIFNVLHANYQIRELALMVAGSVQLVEGRIVDLEEVPAPELTRDYECANAKLSTRLGFIPRHSVLEAVTELLRVVGDWDREALTDPRKYNIRWLELKPGLERFQSVL